MDTTTSPLARIDLVSPYLTMAGDLTGHLDRTCTALAPDYDGLHSHLAGLLGQLDTDLTTDPETGPAAFVDRAATTPDAVERRALLRLIATAGAAISPYQPISDKLPAPTKKRPPTALETIVIRATALDTSERHTCIIGALEAGASTIELANTISGTLLPRPAALAVPGDRDSHPRLLQLGRWIPSRALHTTAARSGHWLLHNSRSPDPDRRNSTIQMAVRQLLDATGLPDAGTLTAKSVRVGGLRRLALAGPDGWQAAVTATGHHNAELTNDLLALHEHC